MTCEEFDQWIAFHELEAWGDDHRQNAALMATVLNSQGGRGKGKPFTADDFLPKRQSRGMDAKTFVSQWKAYADRAKARQS